MLNYFNIERLDKRRQEREKKREREREGGRYGSVSTLIIRQA